MNHHSFQCNCNAIWCICNEYLLLSEIIFYIGIGCNFATANSLFVFLHLLRKLIVTCLCFHQFFWRYFSLEKFLFTGRSWLVTMKRPQHVTWNGKINLLMSHGLFPILQHFCLLTTFWGYVGIILNQWNNHDTLSFKW